jgi:O-antigen/teichoic acid export membrane protein
MAGIKVSSQAGAPRSQRRGVLAILTGTVSGQLVALALSPVLARMYSPSDFGVFAVIAALSATVGTIAALRLDLAVPLPAEERDGVTLALLGLGSAAITSGITTVFVALAGDPLTERLGHAGLMPWLYLVGPLAGLTASTLVLSQLAVRHRRYSGLGRRSLLQSVVTVGGQLTMGAAGLRPGGLLLGLGLGQAAGSVSLISGAGLSKRKIGEAAAPRRLFAMLRSHRRFPLMLAPAGLINVLGLQLPILVVAHGYGSENAGWLSMTQRVLAVPVALLGTAVAQVYLGELVSMRRAQPERVMKLFTRATCYLTAAAIPSAIAAYLFAPAIFRAVFGSAWVSSGVFAQPLAIALAAQLLAAPLSQTLIALERQAVQLCWDIGRLLLVAAATLIPIWSGAPAIQTVWSLSGALTLSYLVSWTLCWHYLRQDSGRVPAALVTSADGGA